MKKITYIFQLFSLVLLLGACEREELKTSFDSEKGIPFSLELTNKTVNSRAAYYTEAGKTGYNENVINRADVFFYIDQTNNAVHKVSYSWEDSGKGPQEQKATLTGTIPTDLLENTTSLYAYAIVNGPDTPGVSEGTDTKIETLKQIDIMADFTTYTPADGGNSAYSQPEFVMDGESELSIASDKKKVSGTIDLNRAASKIALFITKPESFTDGDGNIWYPQESEMSVSFHYGVNASKIDIGTSGKNLTSENYYHLSESSSSEDDNSRFSFETSPDNQETTDIDESTVYTHFPFYSYSSNWGRANNPDKEAYLLLRVYWKKGENGTPDAYYYRIPINVEDYTTDDGTTFPAKQLQRNTYYKILLEVGVLGEKSEQKPLTLTPNYIVVDWNDEPVEVQLADYHYLVVEKNFVEMFNQESVTVGYESCGDAVTAEIISMTRPNFSTNTIGTTTYYSSSDGINTVATNTGLIKPCTVSLENGTIVLNHELQNDYSSKPYDYAVYTIKVRVSTSCGLSEIIEFKQYPSKYITGDNTTYNNGSYGTVWVNGQGGPNKSYSSTSWNRVENTLESTSTENSNPNSYVITVTTFEGNDIYNSNDNTGYIIADPRDLSKYYSAKSTTSSNSDLGYSSASKNHIDGSTNWQLTYYYTTQGSLESAENLKSTDYRMRLIAPKFRFATAYGRKGKDSNIKTRANAVKRCSSYQEFGRPAGRWRVPTPAELDYVSRLCYDGVIPWLFRTSGGGYTSSFGSWTTSGITISDDITSVRCVYDEWYWEDKCDASIFTWGDKIIN